MTAAPPNTHASIVASVDAYLARVVAQTDLPANLAQAISYSLLQGGKRLRPMLVILSCEAVGRPRGAGPPGRGGDRDDPRLQPHPRRPARHG